MKKWWILLSVVPLLAQAASQDKAALNEEYEEPFKGNHWISSLDNDLFNDKDLEFEEEASAYVAEQVDEEESLFPWATDEGLKDEVSSSFYYEDEFDTFADEEQSREALPERTPQRSRPQPSYEKVPQRSQSVQAHRPAAKRSQAPRAEMSEAPARSAPQRDQYENRRQRPSVSASGRQRENSQIQERPARSQRQATAQRPQQRSEQQYREGRSAPKKQSAKATNRSQKRQGERNPPARNRRAQPAATKRNQYSEAQSERSVRVRPLQRQQQSKNNKAAHPGRHPTADAQAPSNQAR